MTEILENVLPDESFETRVDRHVEHLRIQQEAKDRIAREKAGNLELPPLKRLDAFLAEPDDETAYLIDRLWPTGGRVVLAAQQKAGKSTMVGNITRALADGTPFLNKYDTEQTTRIVLVDDELHEGTLRRWLRDQGIVNTANVELVALRGYLSRFNILEESARQRWAEQIGQADVLILDCLRPVLDALGLDENRDAGRFLEALDELTTAAHIPQTLVVHHMGHGSERSRGDSRIMDWPDANWTLKKDEQADDQTAGDVPRYFTAGGRDVDEMQQRLGFDPDTRHLSIVGGSRATTRAENALDDVLGAIRAEPGITMNGIEKALASGEHGHKTYRAAARLGAERGLIRTERGPRNSKLHYVIDLELGGVSL